MLLLISKKIRMTFASSLTLFLLLAATLASAVPSTSTSSTSLPACTFQDYTAEIQNTTCTAPADQRKKIYRLVTDPNFCRGPSVLDLGESVSCVCTFQELEPVYTGNANQCSSASSINSSIFNINNNNNNNNGNQAEQVSSVRTFEGFKKKDVWSTCLLPQQQYMDVLNSLLNTTVRCPCTVDDIASFFSPCIDGAWQRLVYYFQNDCDADDEESVALPPFSYSPCNLVCVDGEFTGGVITAAYKSNVNNHVGLCESCPLGFVSFMGEQWKIPYLAENDDDINMKNFGRECIGLDASFGGSCPSTFGWRASADGLSFTSGNPAGATDVQARMSIDAKFVRYPATLSFEYSVDSELDHDFFEVQIDDSVVLRQSGRVYWQSFSTTIQSPNLFDDVHDHQCQWTVAYDQPGLLEKACFFPNQLFPYDPALFWSITPEQALQHQATGKPVVMPTHLWSFSDVDISNGAFCQAQFYSDRLVSVQSDGNTYAPNNQTILIVSLISPPASSRCAPATMVEFAAAANYSGILFLVLPGDNTNYLRYNRDTFPSSASTQIKIAVLPGESSATNLFAFAQTPSGRTIAASIHYTSAPGITRHIRFVYAKDDSGNSGTDQVLVRNIVITGNQLAATKCRPCPAGFTTPHGGSAVCVPCAMNTFAPTPGSTQCSPCPVGLVSGYAATSCVADRLCAAEDYEAFWSSCQKMSDGNFEKTRTFKLKVPGSCNESGTVSDSFLKSTLVAACNNNCSFGEFTPPGSTNCVSCNANEIAIIDHVNATTTGCTKCLPGTTPIMQVKFDGFWQKLDPLKSSTSCTPTCTDGQGGWEFDIIDTTRDPSTFLPDFLKGVQVIAVGDTVPTGSNAVLQIHYQQQIPGKISFHYFVLNQNYALPGAKTAVTFSVLDATLSNQATIPANVRPQVPVAIFETTLVLGDDTSFRNLVSTGIISPGEFILRWSYTNNQDDEQYIVFGIESLQIDGAQNVASLVESCVPSPIGYASPDGQALACASGTIAAAGSQKCCRVPNGFVNPDRASPVDTPHSCPFGTTSNDARIYCEFPKSGIYTSSGVILGINPPAPSSSSPFKGRPIHTSVSSFISEGKIDNVEVAYEMDVTWLDGDDQQNQGIVIPANKYHDKIHFWGATPQESTSLNCTVEMWSSSDVSYGCIGSPVTGASRSIGSYMTIAPRFSPNTNSMEWQGVELKFLGATCQRYAEAEPNFTTVVVNVDCDLTATEFTLVDEIYYDYSQQQELAKVDLCFVSAFAKYYKACPICSSNNLAYFDDPKCLNGKTTRHYAFVNANGDTMPAGGVCRSNASGAISLPPDEVVDCAEVSGGGVTISSSKTWIALFIVAVVAAVVVGVIVHLRAKNKNLHDRFMKLQEEFGGGGGGEMSGGEEGDRNDNNNRHLDDGRMSVSGENDHAPLHMNDIPNQDSSHNVTMDDPYSLNNSSQFRPVGTNGFEQ